MSNTEFCEATWPRVRMGNISELQGVDYKVMTHVIPLNSREVYNLIDFCLSKLGKYYDWRGLLSFIFRKDIQNKSWYFCSEFGKEACEKADRPLLRRKPNWTTPDDIWSSLMLREDILSK